MTTAEPVSVLVERAKRGDGEAYAAIVRRHLRGAYAVALAILGRPADAEDVAQDAFLVAFERLDSCREPARFVAWLFQIVRNRARNALEARRLRDVPGSTPKEPVAPATLDAEQGVLRDRLLGALARLTQAQREVVLLHDLEGMTHPEIAPALGISEVMSRQHLFQARRVLRSLLDDYAQREVKHG